MSSAKTALVTGARRGLGRNTAISLAKGGFDVVITYQTQQAAASAVVKEIETLGRQARALELDTSDLGSFSAFETALRRELSHMGQQQLFGLVNGIAQRSRAVLRT